MKSAILVLAATWLVAADRAPCWRCDGAALLQDLHGRPPRDCTCINGMKTHAVTSRDELKALGKAGIFHHLKKCQRELEDLKNQHEYAQANGEAQTDALQEKVKRKENALERFTKVEDEQHSKVVQEKKELVDDNAELQKELSKKKIQYNDEFTTFYKLNVEMTEKLDRLGGCASKVAECEPSFFLAHHKGNFSKHMSLLRRSSVVMSPEEEQLYDRIQKVQDCETESNSIAKGIKTTQATARKAIFKADAQQKILSRQVVDRQRINKLRDMSLHLSPLQDMRRTLDDAVKRQTEHVEEYKVKNEELQRDLKELDEEMSACGC